MYFSTGTSLSNYANRLTIDTVGNVGINNNSPWVDLNLATYNNPGYTSSCSLIATDNGSGGNSFQINLKTSGNINNT